MLRTNRDNHSSQIVCTAQMLGPACTADRLADVDILTLRICDSATGTNKSCVSLAKLATTLHGIVGLGPLAGRAAVDDTFVHGRIPLALGPAGRPRLCTFVVDCEVNQFLSKLLKELLGVHLGPLAAARLVQQVGVHKNHRENGEVDARGPLLSAQAFVDPAHLADTVVRVDHAARVKVHL